MRRDPIAPASTFLILNETQNSAFDIECHTSEELEKKFTLLDELNEDRSFKYLDLGGGNGSFADQLLARFPNSFVTIVDVSSALLSKNKLSNRKELIHGSIENISEILAGRRFDYITLNWVLHHLAGKNYRLSQENQLNTLIRCRALLKTNGKLIIAEHMFDGYLESNIPSHIICTITRMKWGWFIGLAKRFFNTAGVGVCFQSQRAWQHMFAEAGFDVVAFQRGLVWWWLRGSLRGVATKLVFLKSVSHGHFFLETKPGG